MGLNLGKRWNLNPTFGCATLCGKLNEKQARGFIISFTGERSMKNDERIFSDWGGEQCLPSLPGQPAHLLSSTILAACGSNWPSWAKSGLSEKAVLRSVFLSQMITFISVMFCNSSCLRFWNQTPQTPTSAFPVVPSVAFLPGQGVFSPDVSMRVLLANGSDGGGCRKHGGGTVFRHDTKEGPRVRSPHRLALEEKKHNNNNNMLLQKNTATPKQVCIKWNWQPTEQRPNTC